MLRDLLFWRIVSLILLIMLGNQCFWQLRRERYETFDAWATTGFCTLMAVLLAIGGATLLMELTSW